MLLLVFVSGCSVFFRQPNGNNVEIKLLTRAANNKDILMTGETDFSSLGAKYTVTPQCDIDGLELKIKVCDKKDTILKTYTKYLGNVVKGVQVAFTISLEDLGLINSLKASYLEWSVVSGTVSYYN